MRKIIFLFVSVFIVDFLSAQTAPPPADNGAVSMANTQGLLRMALTITPSWCIKGSAGNNSGSISSGRTNVYLHGVLEYYWTEHFSTRGDAYYFVNKDKVDGGLKHNHSLQVGCSYHFRKGMGFDPYVGICAGISLVQVEPMDFTRGDGVVQVGYQVPAHLEPVWAPRVGMNLFGQHVFHFFLEAQYLIGTYRPPVGPILSLNEVRVSAGLGFNFVILHKEAVVRPGI
ncbi:MAG TPA: hypothetical protein VFJ43_04720 [Bacteroidia bacterium]|nr:hypothetical protein [Bacteroidia bacterium]